MNYKIILKNKKFEKVNIPEIICDAHSIKVSPSYLGICGSDLFHYLNNSAENICFGHEWFGKVLEVGNEVKGIKVGDIVTTSSTLGCGKCYECFEGKVNYCLKPIHLGSPEMGALTGEMVFNAFNARVLKTDVKSEVLIEVMAVAEEAVRLMLEQSNLENKKILVMGAGTVGILIAYLLKNKKLDVEIIDPHKTRVERAKKIGIVAMTLSQFMIMREPNSFDIIFDATSDRGDEKGGFSLLNKIASSHHHVLVVGKYLKPVLLDLTTLARLGGNIKFMKGVPLSTMNDVIEKWSSKLDELSEFLISHEFKITEVQKAFDVAMENDKSGKVIVHIN